MPYQDLGVTGAATGGLWTSIKGAVSSGFDFAVEKLNLSWILSPASFIPPIANIQGTITVPTGGGVGTFMIKQPDYGKQLGELAINQAQEAIALVELATALQSIVDPDGGIRVKDSLDPYHYENLKRSLQEAGEPVPETDPFAPTSNPLGGALTESGALSGISTAVDALALAGFGLPLLSTGAYMPEPAIVNTGGGNITFQGVGFMPSYALAYGVMNSSSQIKSVTLQYISKLIRNSIDTQAGALLLKSVLADFNKQVADNALAGAGETPPDYVEPKGANIS